MTRAPAASIEFLLNGKKVLCDGALVHTTLLDFLRERRLTGAKERCAEGECGACTVVLVGEDGHRSAYRSGGRDMNIAGKPVPHERARGHVTGEALYTDDLLARFPGILHAWPVLAPHTHALVKSLDVAPALAVPGVSTVLTSADVPGEGDCGPNRYDEALFPTEVMFHQQPVAWVLGETLEAARRAAELVRVEYEPLPAIVTLGLARHQVTVECLRMGGAISVREALRDAVAAFGSGGVVTFASPATPERIFFALRPAAGEHEALAGPAVGAERR